MSKLKGDMLLTAMKGVNVLLLTVPFALCWFCYYAERIAAPYYYWGNWMVVALFLMLYVVFGKTYDAFLISLLRISEMIYSQILAAFFADLIMYVFTVLLTKGIPNLLPLLGTFAGQSLLSAAWCLLAHKCYFTVFLPKKSAYM